VNDILLKAFSNSDDHHQQRQFGFVKINLKNTNEVGKKLFRYFLNKKNRGKRVVN